ncbi:MAG: undecaprenyldiphospho-muramoylpentapeptide beta-N-acetylglucosaminyltransferase [Acidobacteria bacterium]|nr:undecaprenyldiphospho-muramoylpentapeptide beta-N-acetylglucosaminyltransferase [Acidobacteriota bacterium]
MTRVFVMAGGGTGGHVIPGIAVARELQWRGHSAVFVGTREGMEAKLVPQAGFPIEWISIGGMKSLGLLRKMRTLLELPRSVWTARGILRRHNAAGVFSMGGYAAAPVVMAAALTGTPVVLMEPNAMPGMTNRRLARFARAALVSFDDALRHFPEGRAELAGLPVRDEFFRIQPKPLAKPARVLVTGGSRGARTLNLAAKGLAGVSDIAVTLQTGRDMFENVAADCKGTCIDVAAFIDDMPLAFAETDLVVCRSGAGAVAELAAAGKPAILVPYPYAADDHQMANARAMERAGAARVIADKECTRERLAREVENCLQPQTLAAMSAAAKSRAMPGAAARAADLLEQYAGTKK